MTPKLIAVTRIESQKVTMNVQAGVPISEQARRTNSNIKLEKQTLIQADFDALLLADFYRQCCDLRRALPDNANFRLPCFVLEIAG